MITLTVRFNKCGTAAALFAPAVERRRKQAIGKGVEVAKQNSRVDTGRMRDGWKETNEGFANDVPYTVFNEFGTRFMSAQPMARPGAQAMFADFLALASSIEGEIV